MGDPQAPLSKVFAVLDAHALRDGQGRLRDEVHLVSMGDHFDWGGKDAREAAAQDAMALLDWLTSHDPVQVTIILGNHDTSRVGELQAFDDETFARAQQEADAGYLEHRAPRSEEAFRRAWNQPSWEIVSRDFSSFRAEQRPRVAQLLRTGRFRLAFEAGGVLLTHAGVTDDELDHLSMPAKERTDAAAVASALNEALDRAVDAWRGEPFEIPGLHVPGHAREEGKGMLFHRAALRPEVALPVPRRRFPPSRLPAGLTQGIGHIRDKKCRELLEAMDEPPTEGPLRTLRVTGDRIRYMRGVDVSDRSAATMIFLDGAMLSADPSHYELLDLDRLVALRPSR